MRRARQRLQRKKRDLSWRTLGASERRASAIGNADGTSFRRKGPRSLLTLAPNDAERHRADHSSPSSRHPAMGVWPASCHRMQQSPPGRENTWRPATPPAPVTRAQQRADHRHSRKVTCQPVSTRTVIGLQIDMPARNKSLRALQAWPGWNPPPLAARCEPTTTHTRCTREAHVRDPAAWPAATTPQPRGRVPPG